MATYTQSVQLIAEATLASLYETGFFQTALLESEAELTSVLKKYRREKGKLIAEAILSSEEVYGIGLWPVVYKPLLAAPVTLLVPKPVTQQWSATLQVTKAGPYVTGLPVFDMRDIISVEITKNASDGGDATVVLANERTYLIGSTMTVHITVNGVQYQLFTGFLDYESNATYDAASNQTTLTLKDSLSWLADSRRAVTTLVRGTNNATRAGLLASDVGTSWYFTWIDQVQQPDVPGETRAAVIQRVMELTKFPFNAIFPNDGGVIGWDVEITEETPLDVIRLVAESAGWTFSVRPNGDVEFKDVRALSGRIKLGMRDYFQEPGLSTQWGGTYVNRLQVKGASKKYAAFQFQYRNDVVTKPFELKYLGPIAPLLNWTALPRT